MGHYLILNKIKNIIIQVFAFFSQHSSRSDAQESEYESHLGKKFYTTTSTLRFRLNQRNLNLVIFNFVSILVITFLYHFAKLSKSNLSIYVDYVGWIFAKVSIITSKDPIFFDKQIGT